MCISLRLLNEITWNFEKWRIFPDLLISKATIFLFSSLFNTKHFWVGTACYADFHRLNQVWLWCNAYYSICMFRKWRFLRKGREGPYYYYSNIKTWRMFLRLVVCPHANFQMISFNNHQDINTLFDNIFKCCANLLMS